MQIEVVRWPGERGRKKIMVDGVEWGAVQMKQHGCHGPSYYFVQIGGDVIAEKGAYRPRTIEVRKSRWDKDPRTIDDIIMAKIGELIEQGKLKSPEAYQAELERNRAKAREWLLEDQRKQREKAIAKAREIVDGIGLVDSETLTEKIADAIEDGVG